MWPTGRNGSVVLVGDQAKELWPLEEDIELEARDEMDGIDDPVVEDLDPHRTVTYLVNDVPHCYMGHAECYEAHTTERLSDEADCEEDLARG